MDFKWLPLLENVLKCVSKNLYLLSQIRKYADVYALKVFYYAHILPHFNYAFIVWDNSADNHLKKLNSLQRRAAKLIIQEPIDTDTKLKRLGFLTLHQQLYYNKAILMFKTMKHETPSYLQTLFHKASPRYGSTNLIKPLARIDLFQTSFAFSGATVWNSIPTNIRSTQHLSSYKKALRKHLLMTSPSGKLY